MTIKQLLTDEAQKAGWPESKIEMAHDFSDSLIGPGGKAKKMLNDELSDKDLEYYRGWIRFALTHHEHPMIRQYLGKSVNDIIERN